MGFVDGSADKESPCNAGDIGDVGLVPESGISPGGGNENPLQYSCLGNPMDREAWWTIVHGVKKTGTRLSTHTHILFICRRQVLVAAHRTFVVSCRTFHCASRTLQLWCLGSGVHRLSSCSSGLDAPWHVGILVSPPRMETCSHPLHCKADS